MAPTPRELGFAMPAEWAPHEATWLAWPHDPITWPDRLDKAEAAFAGMIQALATHERVELLVKDAAMEKRARARIGPVRPEGLRVHRIPTADSWIRDYGPNFLLRSQKNTSEVGFNRWRFNAWGNKYETLLADDGIPDRLPLSAYRRFEGRMVLEGGSIEVNGAGTLLTTKQCLLNPNRNPDLSRTEIEARLRDHLGVSQILWLDEGIEGDDTDGHIDDIARFVDAHTIVAAVETDPDDANTSILGENLAALRSMHDPAGRAFRIVELPMPGRIESDEGRLPASYANFYIANRTVLLPVFGHANDAKARAVLAPLFPGRTIVPIRCEDVVWGMGTLHCLSQQQPAPVPAT